jgi:hypothetical protein
MDLLDATPCGEPAKTDLLDKDIQLRRNKPKSTTIKQFIVCQFKTLYKKAENDLN